jgi:hypothetical protein
MTTTGIHQTSDISAILIDPASARVLMMPDDRGRWTLLHVTIHGARIWMANVGVASDPINDLLYSDVTILRGVYSHYSDDGMHVDLMYVVENHNADWSPPIQARWVDIAELVELPLLHSEHREVIEGCLREAESGEVPALRPPWARPGWFQTACAWMREQLTERGYIVTTPIVQTKSWGISCLLRVGTDRGDVYFKVSTMLPLFGNEPTLLRAISERYTDAVPAPIAIQPEERWMLMEDFGPALRSSASLEKWEVAVQRFGQLQLHTATQIDELLAIGCLDRRLDILESQIDPLLADDEALSPMTTDEIAKIRSLGPRLKAMCRDLARYRVPYSLNHGDLHSGNITAQTVRFFDWTDACIAHPFLDLTTVVVDVDELKEPTARERIVQLYLELWTEYEPIERLREMWRLAEPLGALHQAVSYQHILATLEPTSKQEMIWGVPEWLRRILKMLTSE